MVDEKPGHVPRELDPVFAEPPVDLGAVMLAAMRLLSSSRCTGYWHAKKVA